MPPLQGLMRQPRKPGITGPCAGLTHCSALRMKNIAAILPSHGSLARKILNFSQGRFLKSSSIAKAHGSITKIFHVPLENLRSDPKYTVPFVPGTYRRANCTPWARTPLFSVFRRIAWVAPEICRTIFADPLSAWIDCGDENTLQRQRHR